MCAGEDARTDASPITASGHFDSIETFSPPRSIDEEPEPKPSIEGAVPTMRSGTCRCAARIFAVSFSTPLPTAITASASSGHQSAASPTIRSSGAGFLRSTM